MPCHEHQQWSQLLKALHLLKPSSKIIFSVWVNHISKFIVTYWRRVATCHLRIIFLLCCFFEVLRMFSICTAHMNYPKHFQNKMQWGLGFVNAPRVVRKSLMRGKSVREILVGNLLYADELSTHVSWRVTFYHNF